VTQQWKFPGFAVAAAHVGCRMARQPVVLHMCNAALKNHLKSEL
jgi:hypothetical protein